MAKMYIVEVVEYGPADKEIYVRAEYDSNQDPKAAVTQFAPSHTIQESNNYSEDVIVKTRYIHDNAGNDYVVAAVTETAFKSLPKWRLIEVVWIA